MIRPYSIMKAILLVTVVFLSITSLCLAGSFPPYIHYQGRLADQETGAPLNGKKDLTFSFYRLESGGDPVYYQTKETDIHNGLFSVYIGQGEGYYDGNMVPDGIPAKVFTEDTTLYLGIRVGDSTTEMSPRHLIGSVAYAYHAEKSNEAEHLKGQVTVSPSGNVGIGAPDPSGLLDVGEGLLVVKDSGYTGIGTTNPSGLLDVDEGGLVVKESGYIGIGTKSPEARLHVTTEAGDGQAFIRASNFNPVPTAYWPDFDETAPYLLRNALWVGWDDSKKAWKYTRESDNDRGVTDPGDPATWVVNGEDTGYFDGDLDTLSPGTHMNNRYNPRMMACRCNQDDIQVKVGSFWIDKYPCRIIDVDSDYTGTTWKDDTDDMNGCITLLDGLLTKGQGLHRHDLVCGGPGLCQCRKENGGQC